MGDRVFVIDSDLMKKGINQNLPVVIDVDDKITALEEKINKENSINSHIRSMVSLVGEISNYGTCYHNKKPKTEEQKQKYLEYINLLSVINGKSIDYSKTGILWHVPRHIAKYSKPLPYFMKYTSNYYKGLNVFNKAQSNMNRLAFTIEKWENKIRYKRKFSDFDYTIMIDNSIHFDEDKFNALDSLFSEFNKDMKDLGNLKHKMQNYEKYKEEFDGMTKYEVSNTEIDWGYYFEEYIKKAKEICPNKKELANLAVQLCYGKYPNKNKKFIWIVAAHGILENLKQQQISLPIEDKDGKYKYLGRKYNLQEVTTIAQ